ncbi:MAG: hypothetical protein GY850_00735 [bacterium]|nr:hypothetical protein [bacterium]
MVRFVHISDLHIRGRKKTESINCEKLIQFIISKYSMQGEPKPVVLVTGDIVDDGKKRQYRSAVKLHRPLVRVQ